MFLLSANHFVFDLSFSVTYASITYEEKDAKEDCIAINRMNKKEYLGYTTYTCVQGPGYENFIINRLPNSFLGTMKGFVVNIGYSFNLGSPKRFFEWDFLHFAGGIEREYFKFFKEPYKGHSGPRSFLNFKNHAIGMDTTFMQFKIGGYVLDQLCFYGIITPCTFIMGNIEGACAGSFNLGFTIGAGMRYFFHKHWGIQTEWSFVKAYAVNSRGKFEDPFSSNLAMNRFSIGICART